jgi:hypothetical protein
MHVVAKIASAGWITDPESEAIFRSLCSGGMAGDASDLKFLSYGVSSSFTGRANRIGGS